MRGKLVPRGLHLQPCRITPAYAGKTERPGHCAGDREDHPRVCGENQGVAWIGRHGEGSPPRMRGKPPPVVVEPPAPGITPAYAGKTEPWEASASLKRDHPRVCGENPPVTSVIGNIVGSPPRMRGKQRHSFADFRHVRITPAYAGKTYDRQCVPIPPRDHPRVCGENPA